jgi:hypothetical protein
MYAPKNDQIAVDEEIWRAWIDKGKLRDQAAARRARVLVNVALAIVAIGIAIYFLAARSTSV